MWIIMARASLTNDLIEVKYIWGEGKGIDTLH
jgi:hypothetical protein